MYEAFYNLKEPPFGSTPDPRFLYRSQGHREALAYIAYGLFGKKGFLAVTGEVGIGKTTVIRAFVHTFHPCLEVAFVLNTNVNFEEMLFLILQDFAIDVEDTSKVRMLNRLNSFLIDRFARHQNPVMIIDEAQNLAPEVLEELRLSVEPRDGSAEARSDRSRRPARAGRDAHAEKSPPAHVSGSPASST